MSYKSVEDTILEITSVEEAATDLGTIHVIHHPTKGYRQKGGGYSKEINRKTKTFKSHDTAAKSDNVAVHRQHYTDKETGKEVTSFHPSTNRGTRVHTVNTATGEVKKGDYLHHHQAKAAEKMGKKGANSPHFPTRVGKTHADDIPKSKKFDHATQKGHYVEDIDMESSQFYADYITKTTFDPESYSVRSKISEESILLEFTRVAMRAAKEAISKGMSHDDAQRHVEKAVYTHSNKVGMQGADGGVSRARENNALDKADAHLAKHYGKNESASVRSKISEERGAPNSECCDAPLKNYNNGTGFCSDCGEHAAPVKDEQKEAATKEFKKNQHTKTPKMEVEPTEIPEQKIDELSPETHAEYQKWAAKSAAKAGAEFGAGKKSADAALAQQKKREKGIDTSKYLVRKKGAVEEKLHGDQHKLDHNLDMKITAADMKMVRKKGAVKDHPMDEVAMPPKDEIMKHIGDTKHAGEAREILKKKYGVDDTYANKMIDHSMGQTTAAEGMSMTALKARRAANPVKPVQTTNIVRSKTGMGTLSRNSVDAERKRNSMQEDTLEEGTFKVQVDGLPVMYIEGDSAGGIKAKLRKKFKDPKAVISIERITSAEKKKELRAKVAEEEQVNELSKKTLGSYINKASQDAADQMATSGYHHGKEYDYSQDIEDKANTRAGKRLAGIQKATKKLTKEGAMKRIATQDAEKERLGPKKAAGTGLDTFKKKVDKVEEISKDTAISYVNKANTDTYRQGMKSGMKLAHGDYSYGSADKKASNRGVGTMRALQRIAGVKKTSNRKDESVNEISSELAGRAYQASKDQTNYKKVTPTTAKKSDQGTKALAYHQRKSIDPSHTGTTYKGSGTDVAADHKPSSEPARKTSGRRIDDYRKKGYDVDEAKDTHVTKDGRTVQKGLWYYMNKRKKAGTSRPASAGTVSPEAMKKSQS